MCGRMVHRGPDDEGYYADDHVVLGMRRLSIIDLAGGHQPIGTVDGKCWIILNGEIYNYRELRLDLERRGHCPQTHSDTEIALLAYREWGVAFVERLLGMFALAIWDRHENQLLLARDRLGKKPLYYTEQGRRLTFASELKCLVADPEMGRELDLTACWDYVRLGYVPGPRTILRGVRRLPPGHILVATPRDIGERPYWSLPHPDGRTGIQRWSRPEAAAEEIGSLLRNAVRARLIADVPIGAFLSGGIDSSTVVALMAEAGMGAVRTFSVGFPEDGKLDETEYSASVARHLGTDHTALPLDANCLDVLPQLAWHLDEPLADPAAIPTLLLSHLARKRVTVVLTGEGADELFGGYERYLLHAWLERARSMLGARMLAWVMSSFGRARGSSRSSRVRRALHHFASGTRESYAEFVAPLGNALLAKVTGPALRDSSPNPNVVVRYLEEAADSSRLGAMQYADLRTWLPDDLLVKVDRTSMAASLEARCPYLDHRLVELAALLPDGWKVKGLTAKWILRRVARGLLSPQVLERRKHIFEVPIARWFRRELVPVAEELLAPTELARHGVFEPAVAGGLLNDHVTGRADYSRALWTMVAFQLWYRALADAPTGGR